MKEIDNKSELYKEFTFKESEIKNFKSDGVLNDLNIMQTQVRLSSKKFRFKDSINTLAE